LSTCSARERWKRSSLAFQGRYLRHAERASWAWLLQIGCIECDSADQAIRVSGVLLDIDRSPLELITADHPRL